MVARWHLAKATSSYISIACLTGSGTISIYEERLQILNQAESKTSQFEIVF